jgi:hypothetical protein
MLRRDTLPQVKLPTSGDVPAERKLSSVSNSGQLHRRAQQDMLARVG